MAERSEDEQAQHDRIVMLVARRRYPRESCRVMTNPGMEENCGLSYLSDEGDGCTVYPDIVAMLHRGREIVAVGEVETSTTLTRGHSGQWRLFAHYANAFYLYVPKQGVDTARSLTQGIDNLHLRSYTFDPQGNIIVTDVPASEGVRAAL